MIYFDNSATTKCSKAAMEIMCEALSENFGNPSSLHNFGFTAEKYIKNTRAIIASTLKCDVKEIVFTSGGTEGNNMAIRGCAYAYQKRGKHIITTSVEHAAVINPCKQLEKEGFEVTYLPVDEKGVVSVDDVKNALRDDTILVAIMYVNNEIGSVMPISQIGSLLKDRPNTYFFVDAIQAYGKYQINPKNMGIDLMSVSGHKLHGPKGSGFLYIKDKVRVEPIILGGGQENALRSGTENVPAIAGLGVAVKEAYDNLSVNVEKMNSLKKHLRERLSEIDNIVVNGPDCDEGAPHIVSVTVTGVRSEVMLHTLEEKGIYVSAGSACSSNKPSPSRTLQAIGLTGLPLESTIRFSFCENNTIDEVDEAIEVMKATVPTLRKFTRH